MGSVSGTQRRVGEFDWEMLRRACHLNSPTDVALTFVDYLDKANSDAIRFDQLTPRRLSSLRMSRSWRRTVFADRQPVDYKCVIDRRRW